MCKSTHFNNSWDLQSIWCKSVVRSERCFSRFALKTFDNVWCGGVLYKLRRMGICREDLGLIDSFLSDRFQRVLLNGQTSKWSQVKAGVPQGSVLWPLLFLVYINDLPEELTSNVKLFADDTSIFSVVPD